MVLNIKSRDEFVKTVLCEDDDQLVIVKYSSPDCGPSRKVQPEYEQLSHLYSDCVFCHINIKEVYDHSEIRTVSSLPTFRIYKRAKCLGECKGSNCIPQIKTLIDNNLEILN